MSDDWRPLAMCRQIDDPTVFFPERGGISRIAYDRARTICGQCPVATECLEEALSYEADANKDNRHGMYGGLTPEQRASLARQRRLRIVA